jgi:hypothetical protein
MSAISYSQVFRRFVLTIIISPWSSPPHLLACVHILSLLFIYSVTYIRVKLIYFLLGHGAKSSRNSNRPYVSNSLPQMVNKLTCLCLC